MTRTAFAPLTTAAIFLVATVRPGGGGAAVVDPLDRIEAAGS